MNESLLLDRQKQEQIAFFKKDFESYEKAVVGSPYFHALTSLTFTQWFNSNYLSITSPILEIACGTGQQTLIMAKKGVCIIAIDLSDEMIRLAKRKTDQAGVSDYVDYIIADAENLPLKDNSFGACVCCSALHHINNPGQIILKLSEKLRNGGLFYTLDSHDSRVRFLFVLAMKIWKLYDDQASDSPLINGDDLATWLNNAKIKSRIKYSTYIPPHLFIALSDKAAIRLLKITDAIFNSIPHFSVFAGVIISEGVRAIRIPEEI